MIRSKGTSWPDRSSKARLRAGCRRAASARPPPRRPPPRRPPRRPPRAGHRRARRGHRLHPGEGLMGGCRRHRDTGRVDAPRDGRRRASTIPGRRDGGRRRIDRIGRDDLQPRRRRRVGGRRRVVHRLDRHGPRHRAEDGPRGEGGDGDGSGDGDDEQARHSRRRWARRDARDSRRRGRPGRRFTPSGVEGVAGGDPDRLPGVGPDVVDREFVCGRRPFEIVRLVRDALGRGWTWAHAGTYRISRAIDRL